MLLSSWNFIFFSLQNKKKLLSNSEIPEWVLCFLTTFNLFLALISNKQKKHIPILEVILAMRQLPFPLGTRLPAMNLYLIYNTCKRAITCHGTANVSFLGGSGTAGRV